MGYTWAMTTIEFIYVEVFIRNFSFWQRFVRFLVTVCHGVVWQILGPQKDKEKAVVILIKVKESNSKQYQTYLFAAFPLNSFFFTFSEPNHIHPISIPHPPSPPSPSPILLPPHLHPPSSSPPPPHHNYNL